MSSQGSVVSDTPQRLWPGAQWTVAVQGTKGQHLVYSIEAQTAPRRKARRADEATTIASPLDPRRGQGACDLQGVPVDELEGYEYQWRRTINRHPARIVTQALLARDELDGWPDLRP